MGGKEFSISTNLCDFLWQHFLVAKKNKNSWDFLNILM